MTDESVSRRLAEIAPVAPELVEAFGRFEHLPYTELHRLFEEHTADLREWVADPQNTDRPISEWPGYLNRIALDALIEQRTWVE